MLLNKIRIKGFKSFANEVELNLEKGITAVVGPNGCGKSNIADSISWALGEQSPTSLRGKKMDQMIFNGSSSRKAMGMAEVTLHLKTPKEIDQYLDFDDEEIDNLERKGSDLAELLKGIEGDVQITRRMFRDGHSEYRLNGKACRLKDIQDLLMALGIGTRSITVIEQDKIQAMISARPVDRRAIIEDAAGITKFKVNKHLTNLKLDHARSNLERISDVIGEQKTLVTSLSRQAGKARRFKQYQADMREIEKYLIKHRHTEIVSKRNQVVESLNEKKRAHASEFAAFEKAESREAELRQSIDELAAEKSKKREAFYQANLELDRQNNRLSFLRESIATLQKRSAETSERIAADKRTLEDRKLNLADVQERRESQHNALKEYQRSLDAMLEEQQAQGAEVATIRTEREKLFVNLSAAREERAGVSSALESLKREKEQLSLSLRRSRDTIERIRQDILEGNNRLQLLSKRDEELANRITDLEYSIERTSDYRTAIKEEIAALERRIQQLAKNQTSTRATLETLTEIEAKREDISEGVRTLLTDNELSRRINTHGVVADHITIDNQSTVPAASAYSSILESVVVESEAGAALAIEHLKKHNLGRSGFVCLDRCTEPAAQDLEEDDLRSALQPASDIGRRLLNLFPPAHRVSTLAEALVRSSNEAGIACVTDSGALARDGRRIHGGGETAGQKLFSRRRRMEELRSSIDSITSELNKHNEQKEEKLARSEEFKQEIAQYRKDVETVQLQRAELRSQMKGIAEQEQRNKRGIQEAEEEINRLDQVRQSIDSSLKDKEADEGRIASKVEELQKDVDSLDESLLSATNKLGDLQQQVEEERAAFAQQQEKAKVSENRLQGLEFELRELKRRIEFDEGELEKIDQQRRFNIQEINTIEKDLQDHAEDNKSLSEELHSLDEQLDSDQQELREVSARVREMKRGLATVNEDIDSLKFKAQELKLALEHLFERAQENLNLSQDEVAGLEAEELEMSVDECMDRLSDLKEKIAGMGAVNLLAEEEYNKHKERYDNLMQQKSDVEESIASLEKVINRIDSVSRQRFKEAFGRINDNFHKIFRILFQGGKAELILGEDDLLEAGIEIMVQPPGKRNQSASLLSGGEKTLSAFALILAVMEYRPTPFCILDESDAALDESNIRRIASLIRDRADYTQFILVTHNKTTMEIADRLYGVTMDEPGVSQVVSVQFQ